MKEKNEIFILPLPHGMYKHIIDEGKILHDRVNILQLILL